VPGRQSWLSGQPAFLLSVQETGAAKKLAPTCRPIAAHSAACSGRPSWRWSRLLERARACKGRSAHRFCMGWAWRDISRWWPPSTPCSPGGRGAAPWAWRPASPPAMLTDQQAERLAAAGLTAYPSPTRHQPRVLRPDHTTAHLIRKRLETPRQGAPGGLTVCWRRHHRHGRRATPTAGLLQVLANARSRHPETRCRSMPWWRWRAHALEQQETARSAGAGAEWWPPLGMLMPFSRVPPERPPRTAQPWRPRSSAAGRARRFDLFTRHPASPRGQTRMWAG